MSAGNAILFDPPLMSTPGAVGIRDRFGRALFLYYLDSICNNATPHHHVTTKHKTLGRREERMRRRSTRNLLIIPSCFFLLFLLENKTHKWKRVMQRCIINKARETNFKTLYSSVRVIPSLDRMNECTTFSNSDKTGGVSYRHDTFSPKN